MTRKQSVPTIQEARAVLRAAGLRATPCRLAVLQLLSERHTPVSHLDACQELEDRGFDKSTIFRTLNDMTEAGIARRMELGDHVWRYEVAKHTGVGHSSEGHPHLLCTDCGSIQCLSDKEVQVAIVPRVGSISEVLLKGRCRQCLET